MFLEYSLEDTKLIDDIWNTWNILKSNKTVNAEIDADSNINK